jgi:hypothetical protein
VGLTVALFWAPPATLLVGDFLGSGVTTSGVASLGVASLGVAPLGVASPGVASPGVAMSVTLRVVRVVARELAAGVEVFETGTAAGEWDSDDPVGVEVAEAESRPEISLSARVGKKSGSR